jgi:hypothetical protein
MTQGQIYPEEAASIQTVDHRGLLKCCTVLVHSPIQRKWTLASLSYRFGVDGPESKRPI